MFGGAPPEVHSHLHSFERVQLQVVLTAPEGQLFSFPSVCRLVTVLDEADDQSCRRVGGCLMSEQVSVVNVGLLHLQ